MQAQPGLSGRHNGKNVFIIDAFTKNGKSYADVAPLACSADDVLTCDLGRAGTCRVDELRAVGVNFKVVPGRAWKAQFDPTTTEDVEQASYW